MRKNKTAAILIISFLLSFLGCYRIEPTYNKEKLVDSIRELCKKEYCVEPKVWLVGESVWVYMPFERLLTEQMQWDKKTLEEFNKVAMGSSRVLLSMRPRPQFLVMVAADIKDIGFDYSVITWIPDIVKYQLHFISRDEYARRNVVRIQENPLILGDIKGTHLKKTDISLGEFLAEQIAQRAQGKLSLDEKFKNLLKVEKVEGNFREGNIVITAEIKNLKDQSLPLEVNTQKEIARIAAYVIKEYDFKDFFILEITNEATGEKITISRAALKDLT